MKKIIFFFSIFLFTEAQAQQPNLTASLDKTKTVSTQFTYKIISSPNNTFGYDIYANGKPMIHQPTPPGMSGNNGFKKKLDAEKVAKFVIAKMKKGEMPPTVTVDDLKKLSVQ